MGVFSHPAAFNPTQMEGVHGGTGSEQIQQEIRCGVDLEERDAQRLGRNWTPRTEEDFGGSIHTFVHTCDILCILKY